MKRYKKIPDELLSKVIETVRGLLHASRDRDRTLGRNEPFYDTSDGYWGSAYGVFIALELQGYGCFERGYAADGLPIEANLRKLFDALCAKVFEEERAGCDYCMEHFGKDLGPDGVKRYRADFPNVKAKPFDFTWLGIKHVASEKTS